MKIALRHNESHAPLTCINSYAPLQGYKPQEKLQHWETLKTVLGNTKKTHTDMVRRHKRTTRKKPSKPEELIKIIGPLTRQSTPEKGNGLHFARICKEYHMIPMNTWKKGKLSKQDKKK